MKVRELRDELGALTDAQQELQIGLAWADGDTMEFSIQEAEDRVGTQLIILEAD